MTLPYKFQVEKVADTKWPAFGKDPKDPLNTVDSGKRIQQITLHAHPSFPISTDPLWAEPSLGEFTFLIQDPAQIGTVKPGAFMEISLREVQ